jgi:hypothetical protein
VGSTLVRGMVDVLHALKVNTPVVEAGAAVLIALLDTISPILANGSVIRLLQVAILELGGLIQSIAQQERIKIVRANLDVLIVQQAVTPVLDGATVRVALKVNILESDGVAVLLVKPVHILLDAVTNAMDVLLESTLVLPVVGVPIVLLENTKTVPINLDVRLAVLVM